MADRFYVNCGLAGGLVELEGPEAHHLATVCRLRSGDRVTLFNGDGHEYPAEVVAVQRRRVTLRVTGVESPRRELPHRLEVAAPLPKGDRETFLLEKLTELGVTDFAPLKTARSVVHPREGQVERLQRPVIEASKQCGRNVLPRVGVMEEWQSYCRREGLPGRRLLAHPGGERWADVVAGGDVAVAVGPEGGFTDAEVATAVTAGWQVVGLGPRILRIETAALALASWFALGGEPGT